MDLKLQTFQIIWLGLLEFIDLYDYESIFYVCFYSWIICVTVDEVCILIFNLLERNLGFIMGSYTYLLVLGHMHATDVQCNIFVMFLMVEN